MRPRRFGMPALRKTLFRLRDLSDQQPASCFANTWDVSVTAVALIEDARRNLGARVNKRSEASSSGPQRLVVVGSTSSPRTQPVVRFQTAVTECRAPGLGGEAVA
jgi:hypothetical protein